MSLRRYLWLLALCLPAARAQATPMILCGDQLLQHQRERNALLASLQIGKVTQRGDMAFLYVFAIKGANALISQVTDDDLGTNSGVNIRTNHFRFDYGLSKKISLQSLLYIQNELRNSGDFPNFFVPLNAFTPRQYRLQEQIVFSF